MKRFVGSALIFAIISAGLTGCVKVEKIEKAAPSVTTVETVDSPQNDFFSYINGEGLEDLEFRYGEDFASSSFDQKIIEDRIADIITEVACGDGYEEGSEEALVKRAYEYYLEYDFENSGVPEDLSALIEEINNASTMDELLAADAVAYKDFGLQPLYNIESTYDLKDSSKRSLFIDQKTSILDADFRELRNDYAPLNDIRDNGTDVEAALYDPDKADEMGLKLAYLVMDIFNNTDMEILEDSFPYDDAKTVDRDTFVSYFDGVDIIGYLKKIGYDDAVLKSFMILDEKQFGFMAASMNDENLDAFKTWETCRVVRKYIHFIAPSHKDLYNDVDYRSPEEQAKRNITMDMTGLVDILYVERYHDKETDDYVRKLCEDIKDGYRDLIGGADWLSEKTRKDLLEKLENIIYVTGSNAKRHDVNEMKDLPGDNWYEFYRNYCAHTNAETLEELSKPVDRSIPGMNMSELNACYHPSLNTVTITCGILIEPFFDPEADYWTNLGGIGMVIAHEMGHAFDCNGIEFDKNGNYDPSWINGEDVAKLKERNEQAIRYFEDNFTVCGVYHVDGEQTLGENYADLGGMECIVSRTKTKEQREALFTNYAKIWAVKKTKEALFQQLETDEHSPEYLRVNSILSTIEEFYETYDVKEGDGMYVSPDKRISRWY